MLGAVLELSELILRALHEESGGQVHRPLDALRVLHRRHPAIQPEAVAAELTALASEGAIRIEAESGAALTTDGLRALGERLAEGRVPLEVLARTAASSRAPEPRDSDILSLADILARTGYFDPTPTARAPTAPPGRPVASTATPGEGMGKVGDPPGAGPDAPTPALGARAISDPRRAATIAPSVLARGSVPTAASSIGPDAPTPPLEVPAVQAALRPEARLADPADVPARSSHPASAVQRLGPDTGDLALLEARDEDWSEGPAGRGAPPSASMMRLLRVRHELERLGRAVRDDAELEPARRREIIEKLGETEVQVRALEALLRGA
jgi:hypothetical protein